MAKAIMIQGTTSGAGKSILTSALCRIFKQDGYKVAPFKSQNMALNSFITKEGLEMGRAQVVQAEAAGIEPSVNMNPILLKPTNDVGSQVIVNGEVLGNYPAKEYFKMKKTLIPNIMNAYEKLDNEYDIIVIEGAGSPAEINLKSEDIVNMGMAKMVKAPVLIVGDIDRGGVFASLLGTVMLLEDDEKNMVKGFVVNKFRGDKTILDPGLKMIEDIAKVPVIGTVPYIDVDIDDEDSMSDRLTSKGDKALVNIAVIRLPRISNFTDFTPFEYIDGVNLYYVKNVKELKNPDMIIIPGSKNTIEDLLWLRQSGLEGKILKHAANKKPVFGICGGYQMLGKVLKDPYNVENGMEVKGLSLLPMETVFEKEKTRTQVKGEFQDITGIFKDLSGIEFEGYEIHMGKSYYEDDSKTLAKIRNTNTCDKGKDGLYIENIYGSYIHGIFDSENVTKEIVKALFKEKNLDFESIETFNIKQYKEKQYDILAQNVRENLNMEYIYKVLEEGI